MMTAVLASASMAFSRETSALLGNALATHAALDNLRNQMDAKLAQMSEKMDAKLMELRRGVVEARRPAKGAAVAASRCCKPSIILLE